MTVKNRHRGSSFDNFLKEEGIFEECTAEAIKRVLSFQLEDVELISASSADSFSLPSLCRRRQSDPKGSCSIFPSI
jgi:hypothetical protein